MSVKALCLDFGFYIKYSKLTAAVVFAWTYTTENKVIEVMCMLYLLAIKQHDNMLNPSKHEFHINSIYKFKSYLIGNYMPL
jgi:hypothetical protein